MKTKTKIGNLFNVFISSKDMLKQERGTVERVIRSLDMNPIRTETSEWFATPDSKEYLTRIGNSNIVVLIVDLAAKIEDVNSARYYQYVKEEVDLAFSLGVPVLAFFKETNEKSRKEINAFVNDVQYKLFSHTFRNSTELSKSVRASLLNELFRKYTYRPALLTSSKKIYKETTSLVNNCKYRLYLSQQTPTLLLGARAGRDYEKDLYNKIKSLITKNKRNRKLEIVLLYDSAKTNAEIENNLENYNPEIIKSNILFF